MLRLIAMLLLWVGPALAADRVTFGLDWKAEAEYGGYYQAVATGIYARHGLEVSIRQGGPQVNQTQLLLAGRLDFNLASNSYLALNFVQQNLPFTAVAAMFQKDPSILLAHPGQGNDSFEQLRGKPIMIGADTRAGWWSFLRARFGYTDDQIRPYTFNLAPFLANKGAIQQGYLGSEPYAIKQEAGFDPVVLLLADAGFSGYGSLITASNKLIAENPDLVQRFLDASIEGWYSYLYGDPAPANGLMKKDNPEMTDGLLDYGRRVLRERGIVDSGDAIKLGIGAMTDARWEEFFRSMQQQGLYPPDLDWKRAYTVRFVDKGVGVSMRPH
ncbi:MAG TPA: ABC transporter substrate-binding protein [Acetobacteraceae bacterium]|jgi:NitT/TauT family transport system substrate-binding protein|nr:ABC transporter substrate-binding protein [Acetobacteraceae bacterium]